VSGPQLKHRQRLLHVESAPSEWDTFEILPVSHAHLRERGTVFIFLFAFFCIVVISPILTFTPASVSPSFLSLQMPSVRRVGLVGSSGGGRATLGHGDASALVARVRHELSRVGRQDGGDATSGNYESTTVVLAFAQVVHCAAPLDRASLGGDVAQLVVLQSEDDDEVSVACRGTLAEVNAKAREIDRARFGPSADADGAKEGGRCDEANAQSLNYGAKLLRSGPHEPLSPSSSPPPPPPPLDALIFVSSSPLDVNLNAAAWCLRERLPVVATGGTSVGQLLALGVEVGGSSGGSVATTPTSKAVSYAASLAGVWNLPYTPSASSTASALSVASTTSALVSEFYGAAHSVLGGCLPVFLAVSLLRAVLALLLRSSVVPEVVIQALALRPLEAVLRSGVLSSVAVAASAAVEASGGLGSQGLGELAVLAGCVAGGIVACAPHLGDQAFEGIGVSSGGNLSDGGGGDGESAPSSLAVSPVASSSAALFAGFAAGKLAPCLLAAASRRGAPATAASLLSGGLGGVGAGWAGLVLRLPQLCTWGGATLRDWGGHPDVIASPFPTVTASAAAAAPSTSALLAWCSALSCSGGWWWQRAVVGSLLGAGVLHGSLFFGLYHALLLPLLVVEMESGQWGLLGSFDLCCLVLPCAGLCAGTLLADQVRRCGVVFADQRRNGSAQPSGWAPLCKRGLWLNLAFGDFVEAAIPLMERSQVCALGAYVGAAAGGAVVNVCRCRSSAYLPLPFAIGLVQAPSSGAHAHAVDDDWPWGLNSSGWSAQASLALAALVSFGVPALVCACAPVAPRPVEPAFAQALGLLGKISPASFLG